MVIAKKWPSTERGHKTRRLERFGSSRQSLNRETCVLRRSSTGAGASRGVPRRPSLQRLRSGWPAVLARQGLHVGERVWFHFLWHRQLGFEHGVAQPWPPGSAWAARACFASRRASQGDAGHGQRTTNPGRRAAAVGPGASQGAPRAGRADVGRLAAAVGPPVSYCRHEATAMTGTPVPAPGLRCSATVLPCLRRLRQAETLKAGAPITTKNKHCVLLTSVRRTPPLALCRSDSRSSLGRSATRSSDGCRPRTLRIEPPKASRSPRCPACIAARAEWRRSLPPGSGQPG